MIVSTRDCCNTLSRGEQRQRERHIFFLATKQITSTHERQITVHGSLMPS